MYNWYAVNDNRNIAPEGWHVSTEAEWQTLEDYLGGIMVAASKMMETGTVHWNSPNTNATNESGFSALPGGLRFFEEGSYFNMGSYASFWSSGEYSSYLAWGRYILSNYSAIYRNYQYKRNGFSILCVGD